MKRGAIDLAPEFSASATQIIKNQSVTFTNATTGGYIGVPETYSWLFPGGTPATSSDKDPVITYSQVGTHDVTLIVDRGSQIDTLVKPGYITVTAPVGIDPGKQISPLISPNPCNGNFKIALDGPYDMKIMDVLGKVVYSKTGNMGTANFNIRLPSGTYFVSIESDSNKRIQKLLVN